jgi:hypothetical protein
MIFFVDAQLLGEIPRNSLKGFWSYEKENKNINLGR